MSCALVSIEAMGQLIPALCALNYYRKSNLTKSYAVIIFIKPQTKLNVVSRKFIQTLFSNDSSVSIIEGNHLFRYLRIISYLPVLLRVRWLKQKLPNLNLTEFYYAHDLGSDFWNQTIMQAFPQALRICYGDALGLVYSHNYFLQQLYSYNFFSKLGIYSFLGRLKRSLVFPTTNKILEANLALLILPCDPNQDVLNQCRWSIVEQEILKNCVKQLAEIMPEYKTYTIINTTGSQSHLLLLSNFAEAKLTSLANEIQLYREIILTHTQANDKIIIKPHIAFNKHNLDNIIASLQCDFDVELIDNKYFSLPIELAENLIHQCQILSVSYSSISIPYIYGKEVKHVLTTELIKRYFNPARMQWVLASNDLYLNLIAALATWDRKTPLLSQ